MIALGLLVLRVYAGCVFSASPWTGALVFLATAWSPVSCALGLCAVASALATAYALGLVSSRNPPSVYTYGALFLGLGATSTFGHPLAALALATLGAASAALLTASVREVSLRFVLPSLSWPFWLVYACAVGAGRALDLGPSAPVVAVSGIADQLWWPLRVTLQALGAVLCNPRVEVGVLVCAALYASSRHALLLALLGFAVGAGAAWWLRLGPALCLAAALNATFTALALGMGWRTPSLRSYARAALGALLCACIAPVLADALDRVDLLPIGLPFTLSLYALLLLEPLTAPRVHLTSESTIARGALR